MFQTTNQYLKWRNCLKIMLPNRQRTIQEHCFQHQIYCLIYIPVFIDNTPYIAKTLGRCLILETCIVLYSFTNKFVGPLLSPWCLRHEALSQNEATPISGHSIEIMMIWYDFYWFLIKFIGIFRGFSYGFPNMFQLLQVPKPSQFSAPGWMWMVQIQRELREPAVQLFGSPGSRRSAGFFPGTGNGRINHV